MNNQWKWIVMFTLCLPKVGQAELPKPLQYDFTKMKHLVLEKRFTSEADALPSNGKVMTRTSPFKIDFEAKWVLDLINDCLHQGELNKAESLIKEGLDKNPHNYELYIKKAELYELKGEYALALNYLAKLPKYLKKKPFYYGYQAYLNLGLKNFNQSKLYYEKLIRIEPDNAYWQLGLANALDLNGEMNAALKVYQPLLNKLSDLDIKEYLTNRIESLHFSLKQSV